MSCKPWNFNSLLTFFTNIEHGTSIKKMKISVVLIFKHFVESFTEFAGILRIWNIFGRRNINKLVLCFLKFFMFLMFNRNLLSFFIMRWKRFFIKPSIISISTLNLLFYWFEYLWAKGFEVGLHAWITDLIWQGADKGNSWVPNITVFIVCILDSKMNNWFIVFP